MRRSSLTLLAATLLASLPGCGADAPALERAVQATGPALGKADGGDQADRACQIVLRGVGRLPGGDDYQTACVEGRCNYLWEGSVEVAESSVQGATVQVLYRRADDPSWWQVQAAAAADGQPGFSRYSFQLSEHLFGPQASAAEQAALQIQLIPFLQLPDGSRIFDHNRRPGDFDTYVLEQGNGFGLGGDGACQPVLGRISFLDNWDEVQFGELRQGGYLLVDYSLGRLPQCRGTHNGYPAWDITATLRFSPGGQELSGSVRTLDSANGVPQNSASPKSLAVKIPADAEQVEIWFVNATGAGSSCLAYDSNLGQNYRFDVWPAADDPRCQGIERWTAINSDMPYAARPHCLDYTVDQDIDAGHCEVYPSGLGDGRMSHYGIPNGWIEAYLTVGPQQGQLLGVGMLTLYRDGRDGTSGQRWTFARQVGPDSWQTGFIYLVPTIMGSQGYQHQVQQLAFFVDVRRPSGEVVRIWQSRQGANYSWDDAFSLPTSLKNIPYGGIKYASEAAPLFEARRSCEN